MKILILHCSYKFRGGEDTVVEEEIKLLKSQGHQVELLLFSNSGNNLLKVFLLPFNLPSYNRTRQAIKNFKPDIVHIHNLHFAASPSVFYAIRKSSLPLVNTLHNYRLLCPSGTLFHSDKLFLDSLHQRFPWTAIKKGVYRNSKPLTFWLSFAIKFHQWMGTWKLCNKYIVLTEHSRQMLLQSPLGINKGQIVVKPNFCDPPEVKVTPGLSHFLYIGRLSIEKGVRLVLKTFVDLGYEIRIAGDGPLKDEVVEYSKKFPNIRFLGSIDEPEVYKQLQSCSALVFPSIWFEGMPLIIIEAFAAGTPVIATDLGAMSSMIIPGYNGLHFKPDCQQDLGDAVQKWVQLPEGQRLNYRKNAQDTHQQFYSKEQNARQLIDIYNSAIMENQN